MADISSSSHGKDVTNQVRTSKFSLLGPTIIDITLHVTGGCFMTYNSFI